ncbi:MAG: 30S ribosomal protein S2 [bacterium]
MYNVSMKQLLEAGVHFGHQAKRWNPKMKKYLFIERNGIFIIDLQKTLRKFKEAYNFVKDTCSEGGKVIFVGTKKQAQEVIQEEALRCNMSYVNQRWLGGMLTNFDTIQKSLVRLKKIEELRSDGNYTGLTKKEASKLEKKRQKMEKVLRGIKDMDRLPDAVFIIDTKRERIAVNEANKLEIPVIAIVDTNADPDGIDFPIPGNDDAIRSLKLITSHISDAVMEGNEEWLARLSEIEEEKKEEKLKEEKAPYPKARNKKRIRTKDSDDYVEKKADVEENNKEI